MGSVRSKTAGRGRSGPLIQRLDDDDPECISSEDDSGTMPMLVEKDGMTYTRLDYLKLLAKQINERKIQRDTMQDKSATMIDSKTSNKFPGELPSPNLPVASTDSSFLSAESIKTSLSTTVSSLDYASQQMIDRMKSLPMSQDTDLEVAKVACLCVKNLREIVKTKIELTKLALEVSRGK